MKAYWYIAIFVLVVACKPQNKPTSSEILQLDSVFTTADFRMYGDYYESGHQVYAIDLLSEGLAYDSTWHISGTGCNLFLSDIFAAKDSTTRLPAGTYTMDSVANEMNFLRGMYFDGDVTGTYLLTIEEDKIQRIMLFIGGTMTIDYVDDHVALDFNLYLADSTRYHARYVGPAMYR